MCEGALFEHFPQTAKTRIWGNRARICEIFEGCECAQKMLGGGWGKRSNFWRGVFEMRDGELYAHFSNALSKRGRGEGAAKCANFGGILKMCEIALSEHPSPLERECGGIALIAGRHSGKCEIVLSEHTPYHQKDNVEKTWGQRSNCGETFGMCDIARFDHSSRAVKKRTRRKRDEER